MSSLLPLAILLLLAPPTPDLAGSWAVAQITAVRADVPMVGETTERTRALALWQVTQRGTQLQIRETLCELTLDSGTRAYRAGVSPRLASRIGTTRLDGKLVNTSSSSASSSPGWTLRTERRWQVLGARLERPAQDALPTRSSDRRIVDTDGDGEPGITVRIRGLVDGEIHLVQRIWTELEASVSGASPARVSGAVRWDRAQSLLDATSPLLGTLPSSTPDLGLSQFQMRRLKDSSRCSDVVKAF